MRRFRSGVFVVGGNSRKHRLSVIDAAPIDNRRRIVLVKRDDVEHLILIGGMNDVVIERDIGKHPTPAVTEASQPQAAKQKPILSPKALEAQITPTVAAGLGVVAGSVSALAAQPIANKPTQIETVPLSSVRTDPIVEQKTSAAENIVHQTAPPQPAPYVAVTTQAQTVPDLDIDVDLSPDKLFRDLEQPKVNPADIRGEGQKVRFNEDRIDDGMEELLDMLTGTSQPKLNQ
ncbi:MAG: flagellar biosynthetic protein FliO [Ahrensia sp.]|nr:flagellar biosynthetic protein FliO [Ahrensia sp.]